jgi:hypothetical protein
MPSGREQGDPTVETREAMSELLWRTKDEIKELHKVDKGLERVQGDTGKRGRRRKPGKSGK